MSLDNASKIITPKTRMTSTLPKPLLKLFTPNAPIDYLPPIDSSKRQVGFTPAFYFLQTKDNMQIDVPPPVDAFQQRLQEQFNQRDLHASHKTRNPKATLFLANFPRDVTKEALSQLVSPFKTPLSIHVILKKRSRYAFIEFESESDAKHVLRNLPRQQFNRKIVVDLEKGRTFKQFIPNKYKLLKKQTPR